MERRKLVCGDAYAFQGDERDVMFLSMVSAPTEGHRIGTLSSPKDERRFNVAVSRAKDQLWLVHSATPNDLSPKCLRYRLLQYCLDPHLEESGAVGFDLEELRLIASRRSDRQESRPPDPFDSWFEVDVFLRIANRVKGGGTDLQIGVETLVSDSEPITSNSDEWSNGVSVIENATLPMFGTTTLPRAESITDDEVWDAISRFIPASGKIKGSELLRECAAWLHSPLNRHVRSRLNKSISAKIRAGTLKVDEDWEHVWRR